MKQNKVEDLFDFLPKSRIKAGDGQEKGAYPFYTSSEKQSKFLDQYLYEPRCLVFGTGGNASVHLATSRFATSTDCITIKPKPHVSIDAGYAYQYFKANMQILEKGFRGAGLKHISHAYISDIHLPHPEKIDDQIRIAHLLGKVEGLIAQRQQQLQQLDDLSKSVFLEMFGDPIANPRGYPVRKLYEFYINPRDGTKCGPFGSALKKDELVESGVPVWNMDNIDPSGRMVLPFRMWITENKYQELRSYSVLDGDIIISRAGTVGKMCVAVMNGEPAIISTNLIRLRLGSYLRPLHFVSLMSYCKGRVGRLKTGADGAFTHMNTGILDKLEFPYPQIELQDQFAAIVSKVEAIKSRYQQSLADLDNLYGALSQKAFKGELDLSRVPLPDAQELREKFEQQEQMNGENVLKVDVADRIAFEDSVDIKISVSEKSRLNLLNKWLDAYKNDIRESDFFSPENLIKDAQNKISELIGDETQPFSIAEYDYVKNWIFQALEKNQIQQTYDDAKNLVVLKKTCKAGEV